MDSKTNKPEVNAGTNAVHATITVKRQSEIRSKRFGVYRNGALIEGGFFSRHSAEFVAAEYRKGGAL